jgi:hypothetical protein
MPLPQKRQNESRGEFVTRCYTDTKMISEYPREKQRMAVCLNLSSNDELKEYGIRGGKKKFETYTDYPQYISDTAQKALNWMEKNGNPNGCMTQVGKVRLRTLAQHKPISLDVIKRMKNYITRHRKDLETSKDISEGCGTLSMMAWGAERSTIDKVEKYLDRKITQIEG